MTGVDIPEMVPFKSQLSLDLRSIPTIPFHPQPLAYNPNQIDYLYVQFASCSVKYLRQDSTLANGTPSTQCLVLLLPPPALEYRANSPVSRLPEGSPFDHIVFSSS